MARKRLTSTRYECHNCGQHGVYVIGEESFADWAERTYGPGHPYQADGFVPLLCTRCEGPEKRNEEAMIAEIKKRLKALQRKARK